MNARFALSVLAGAAMAAGCTGKSAPPARGRAQPEAARQTSAAVTPLTPEQQRKISTLRATMQQKLAPVQPRLADAQAELRRLWSAEKPNRTAILAAQKQLLGLVQKNLAIENEFHIGLRGVLSRAQRAGILGDDFSGVGSALGSPLGGERGAGIGQMSGGPLSGSLSGAKGGRGFSGSLAGCLGSLFGAEGGGGGEEEDKDKDKKE